MTDDDVLQAIETVRERDGSVTYRALAQELSASHSAVRYRILHLQEVGLVEILAGRAGAIRLVDAGTPRRSAAVPVTGTVTLQIEYDPDSRKPLHVEVLDATGAVAKRGRGSRR